MDYDLEIARLQKRKREAEEAKRKAQDERWAAIKQDPNNWEWAVADCGRIKEGLFTDFAGCQSARVAKRVRPEICKKWAEGGCSTFSDPWQDGGWLGMLYLRTEEGILTHAGGGTLILKDPMLCSEDEWELILECAIPAKFIR